MIRRSNNTVCFRTADAVYKLYKAYTNRVQLRFAFSDRVGRKSEKTVVVVVKFFIVVVVAVVVTLYTHGQAS